MHYTGEEVSKPAFGKTFTIKALNLKGEVALISIYNEKEMPAEKALITKTRTSEDPYVLNIHIKDEEFTNRIKEVSDETAKKLSNIGIKDYQVEMQVELLKKNMSIKNVLEAITKQLKKYHASLYDVEITIK